MAGHLSTQTLPAFFPHNTRWPCPSDSSVYLYLKGGSLVQMLLIFHLKPRRVTTASINPWSIVPACPPSHPHPLSGSWLGLWAIGTEHLQGGTCPRSLLPVSWTGAPGSTAGRCLGAYQFPAGHAWGQRGVGSCPVAGPLLAPVLTNFSPDSVGVILDEAPASSPHTPLSPPGLWPCRSPGPLALGQASPGRNLRAALSAG